MTILAAFAVGVSAVGAVATAKQVPAHPSLSGLALRANTATAIFGGTAPYAAYLLHIWPGPSGTPGIMIAVIATVSGLVLLRSLPFRTAPSPRQI